MLVWELIEALMKMPPNLVVWADGDDRECPIHAPEIREADDEYPTQRVTV
jgi:hypothetical protein